MKAQGMPITICLGLSGIQLFFLSPIKYFFLLFLGCHFVLHSSDCPSASLWQGKYQNQSQRMHSACTYLQIIKLSELSLPLSFFPVTTWCRWVMWESTSCGPLRSLSFWLTSSSGTWRPTYSWTRKETRKTVRYSPSLSLSDSTHACSQHNRRTCKM